MPIHVPKQNMVSKVDTLCRYESKQIQKIAIAVFQVLEKYPPEVRGAIVLAAASSVTAARFVSSNSLFYPHPCL